MNFALTRRFAAPWFLPLGIALAAFVVFAHTLAFDFVYDDRSQILENPWIWEARFLPNLVTEAVWSFKGEGGSNYFRPVQTLGYFLVAQVFGRNPAAFHGASVLTHLLTSVAAYFLLRRITGPRRAAFGALLFAVHPAHVESVAWIAGSTDLNCGLLAFCCLLAWSETLRSTGRRRALFAVLAGVLFFLDLLSKETAVVVPLLALLLPHRSSEGKDVPASARPLRQTWLVLAVSGVAFLAYLGMRVRALGGLWAETKHQALPISALLASGLGLIPRHLFVAFVPMWLVPDRAFDPATGLADPWSIAGALILASAFAAAVACRRAMPQITFGIALLLLPLFPVLQIQWVGTNAQADRYLYIPSLGACLLAAEAAAWALRRMARPWARAAVAAACAMLVVLCMARTVTASAIWRDNYRLTRAGLALEPRSINMRTLRASVLAEDGRYDEAYRVAAEVAALQPEHPGVAAFAAGLKAQRDAANPQQEVRMLREALALYPGYPYLLGSLSSACLRARMFEEARDAGERALALTPNNLAMIVNLASALGGLGDYAGQEREARRALQLDSRSALAWLSLAEARLRQGDFAGYEDGVRRAAARDPTLPRAHLGLSVVAEQRGDLDEALSEAEKAVALSRADAKVWAWLAVVRERRGDLDGARAAYSQALVLAPDDPAILKDQRRLR